MTPRRKNALGILLSIALAAAVLSCRSCAGGEYHDLRKSQRITARPMKWEARAKAGYPVATTAANVTGLATGIPVALAFNVLKFIVRPASPQFQRGQPCRQKR